MGEREASVAWTDENGLDGLPPLDNATSQDATSGGVYL
jgi:hypothetical protein